MVEDAEAALADAQRAREAGADLVEYRIDRIQLGRAGREEVARLVAESPLPCVLTCRSAFEGGEFEGDDEERIGLYEWILRGDEAGDEAGDGLGSGVRYIDIEHATLAKSAALRAMVGAAGERGRAKDLGTGLIVSTHDFNDRPGDLFKRLSEMRQHQAASVLKIAFRARSLRDNLELFDILRERDRPTIALGMGEFGLMSRVLAPKFGGLVTFASLEPATATAPGQPTIKELLGKYRFRSIVPGTAVYGVIGWPVEHSASPAFHNAAFKATDHNGVYLPLPVPEGWEHFKATVLSLLDVPDLCFAGASVTMPHKENMLRLARLDRTRRWEIDAVAELAGAANTLTVGADGVCRVSNTDAPAMVELLEESLGVQASAGLCGKRVGVLGAGGVARAAVAGLVEAGAAVVVFNRSPERAQQMVDEISERSGERAGRVTMEAWEGREDAAYSPGGAARIDAWINATAIGMEGGPAADDSVFSEAALNAMGAANNGQRPVILETVYQPARTRLVQAAEAAQLRVVPGRELFVRQALRQARQWTGVALNSLNTHGFLEDKR